MFNKKRKKENLAVLWNIVSRKDVNWHCFIFTKDRDAMRDLSTTSLITKEINIPRKINQMNPNISSACFYKVFWISLSMTIQKMCSAEAWVNS